MKKKTNTYGMLQLTAIHFQKELRALGKDSGALLILVGAMLIYPIVYSVGYFNEVMTDIPVAVVDQDRTPISSKYVAMINASSELHVSHLPCDLKAAESLFMNDMVKGVVLLPKGFQKDIMAGIQAHVAVYADAGYFLKYKNTLLALSYVNAYFSGGISVKRYMAEGKSLQQAQVSIAPIEPQVHMLYNPSAGYGSFIMPGLVLIMIQQTLLIGIGLMGGSFSESKESPFLLPLPKRRREVLPLMTGKTGVYLMLSVFTIALSLVCLHSWFGYPDKGHTTEILIVLLPYVLAVIFLGIGISTLFRHRESALVFMVFLSPVVLFVSGLSWPESAMPHWIAALSKAFPSSWAVPAYIRMRTMGVGLTDVKPELISLYIQVLVYGTLTIGYFYWRVKRDEVAVR